MLELVFRLQNDWTEILDFADNLLVFLIRSLQDNDNYAAHLQAAKRLYPSSRSFKLGLNSDGRLIRLTFREAKAILRDKVGLRSNELDDLTYVLFPSVLSIF
jgi:aspartyl-tRNA synthetase